VSSFAGEILKPSLVREVPDVNAAGDGGEVREQAGGGKRHHRLSEHITVTWRSAASVSTASIEARKSADPGW
jgi:hypothetical protein